MGVNHNSYAREETESEKEDAYTGFLDENGKKSNGNKTIKVHTAWDKINK